MNDNQQSYMPAYDLAGIKSKEASYGLVLQRHKALSQQLTISTVVNRILSFLCLILLIVGGFIIPSLRVWPYLLAVEVALLVICAEWFYKGRSLGLDVRALEEMMMQETGGNWEDRYIKFRYKMGQQENGLGLFLPEAFFWLNGSLLIIALVALQTFFPGQ